MKIAMLTATWRRLIDNHWRFSIAFQCAAIGSELHTTHCEHKSHKLPHREQQTVILLNIFQIANFGRDKCLRTFSEALDFC
jgi:hypothetical protein